jgi:hypothetical protein
MNSIGEDIWVHNDTMKLMGTTLALRMTIIKLSSGLLWVHSPTALDAALKNEIAKLGPVGFIVGASNGHNIWLQQWQDAFPDAHLYVSGGIPKKLKLKNYQLLDEKTDNVWADDLQLAYMPAVSFFNESVFLHNKSASLIVTDLIQNHSAKRPAGFAGFITRFLLEPLGFKGMCIAPPLKLGFTIKDKPNFAAFIEKIRVWNFKRIIVTHGDIIESNAKQVFTDLCKRFVALK